MPLRFLRTRSTARTAAVSRRPARRRAPGPEPPARGTHQVRFRRPGYVVVGDDGVFRLNDDGISVDEERSKRVVFLIIYQR